MDISIVAIFSWPTIRVSQLAADLSLKCFQSCCAQLCPSFCFYHCLSSCRNPFIEFFYFSRKTKRKRSHRRVAASRAPETRTPKKSTTTRRLRLHRRRQRQCRRQRTTPSRYFVSDAINHVFLFSRSYFKLTRFRSSSDDKCFRICLPRPIGLDSIVSGSNFFFCCSQRLQQSRR